jgi:WhiB family transcriptional regulator, redox-sensing transcriptional regulator
MTFTQLTDLPTTAHQGDTAMLTLTRTAVLAPAPEIDFDPAFEAEFADRTPTVINWTFARCRDGNGTLTHLFFSDEVIDIARAKAICAKCPLQAACLEGALERAEPWGVWGGELIESGRIRLNKRPRGRPPKTPRPPLVVDEVPLPPHLVA